MKEIRTTQGPTILIDDDDFDRISKWRWNLNNRGYAYRRISIYGDGKKRQILMLIHREIMGAIKGEEVDHRNQNPLDNQKLNLRICSRLQNAKNTSKRKSSTTSKYKGVSWEMFSNRFRAVIYSDGRYIAIGRFKTEIDAAKAYNAAALKYHGEFSKLNEVG